MKIKVSNKSSGLILEDGKEIHFWLPKMDKSDSPPPNSARAKRKAPLRGLNGRKREGVIE
jgi:hypothetical protein